MSKTRVTWQPLLLPILAGVAAAWLLDARQWIDLTVGLLPALSVVGAAALVRLSRAFPVGNADQFTPDDATRVTVALETLARSLRMLIRVLLVTMVGLVVLPRLINALSERGAVDAAKYLGIPVSGIMAAAVVFVLVRLLQVVNSDVQLVDLQAKMFREAATRAHDKKFEEETAAARAARDDFRTPENFGTVLKSD